ncbi:hypothetical protein ANCCAN_16721 [Ancylostoma caninum]|uniref:Uncharacterized protein n=1 Tax=Ancylostoma caninum TaxID=29170 RepID=A0A368G0Z3_ANCCA|nr:hypothetical protein ANCCAN_16721 [Ancylostoma caninum]
MRIKLYLTSPLLKGITRGTAVYENVDKKLPHLCSRIAVPYEKTLNDTKGSQPEEALHDMGGLRQFTHSEANLPANGAKYKRNTTSTQKYDIEIATAPYLKVCIMS